MAAGAWHQGTSPVSISLQSNTGTETTCCAMMHNACTRAPARLLPRRKDGQGACSGSPPWRHAGHCKHSAYGNAPQKDGKRVDVHFLGDAGAVKALGGHPCWGAGLQQPQRAQLRSAWRPTGTPAGRRRE